MKNIKLNQLSKNELLSKSELLSVKGGEEVDPGCGCYCKATKEEASAKRDNKKWNKNCSL